MSEDPRQPFAGDQSKINGYTISQWHQIAQNAQAAHSSNPNDAHALQALQDAGDAIRSYASGRLHNKNVAGDVADFQSLDPGPTQADASHLLNSATFGAANAIGGPQWRAYQALGEEFQPSASARGDIVGAVVPGELAQSVAGRIVPRAWGALGRATGALPADIARAAAARAVGAGVPGAVAGYGLSEGSIPDRLKAAVLSGTLTAALGAAGGMRFDRGYRMRVKGANEELSAAARPEELNTRQLLRDLDLDTKVAQRAGGGSAPASGAADDAAAPRIRQAIARSLGVDPANPLVDRAMAARSGATVQPASPVAGPQVLARPMGPDLPVGDAQMPGSALHDPAGNPIPESIRPTPRPVAASADQGALPSTMARPQAGPSTRMIAGRNGMQGITNAVVAPEKQALVVEAGDLVKAAPTDASNARMTQILGQFTPQERFAVLNSLKRVRGIDRTWLLAVRAGLSQ